MGVRLEVKEIAAALDQLPAKARSKDGDVVKYSKPTFQRTPMCQSDFLPVGHVRRGV